ncbi:transposase [Streptococcus pneumoniae]|nr:transposase [Streptococcus pneumoniae]
MSLLETAKRHQLNSEKYLSYLLECLPNEETLVNKEVLEAYLPDETSYRVLESDSQLTYYCTFLSGKSEKQGITLYHHDQRRSGLVVQEFLGDYSGYVHCDMLRQ